MHDIPDESTEMPSSSGMQHGQRNIATEKFDIASSNSSKRRLDIARKRRELAQAVQNTLQAELAELEADEAASRGGSDDTATQRSERLARAGLGAVLDRDGINEDCRMNSLEAAADAHKRSQQQDHPGTRSVSMRLDPDM